jgi:hypothetical protein
MSKALIWYYYYHLQVVVEEADSLQKAVTVCRKMVDSGDGDPDSIEAWDDNGVRQHIRGRALEELLLQDRQRAQAHQDTPSGGVAAAIHIKDPSENRWHRFDSYPTLELAEAKMAELAPLLGDRVRLVRPDDDNTKSASTG